MKGKGIATPSNFITILRILLVGVYVFALLAPWEQWVGGVSVTFDAKRIIAAALFIIVGCTDWLDGYLARSRNEVTDFGKFMDPLADKILVAGALVALVELGEVPSWVVIVILVREFIISGVRMVAATKGQVIAASYIGKSKTVFTMAAIVLFTIKGCSFFYDGTVPFGEHIDAFSWTIMAIAIVLTVVSMIDYLFKAKNTIGLGGNLGPESSNEAIINENKDLARNIISKASEKGLTIVTAESLTGGLIAATLTEVPGSSSCIKGSFVTYAVDAKRGFLSVSDATIEKDGVVSAECAREMVQGAQERSGADIAVSVTGIAGPTGAEPGKPVGTVWMGLSSAGLEQENMFSFDGDREAIRLKTVNAALKTILRSIEGIEQ